MKQRSKLKFSAYQVWLIVILAAIQFTVVLDFLVMGPLGDPIRKGVGLDMAQFGLAVSVYALSAGAGGILVAGFADKYRRKSLLVFAYVGFVVGTLLCAVANSYWLLLLARMVAGLFGGIVLGTGMAMITDVFPYEQRGRVMSFVQMSFAMAQIAGLPLCLLLADAYGWTAPFHALVVVGAITFLLIVTIIRSVPRISSLSVHPFRHLLNNLLKKEYLSGYLTVGTISLHAYMFFPFAAQYIVNNTGILQEDLGLMYMMIGICTLVFLPLIGRLCDRFGKLQLFLAGTVASAVLLAVYVNFDQPGFSLVCIVTAVLYGTLMVRQIASQTLLTALPEPEDRGAFMSINASAGQILGGLSSILAGHIIQYNGQKVLHFDWVGYICIAAMAGCCLPLYHAYKVIVKKAVVKELKNHFRSTPAKTPSHEILGHESPTV